MKSHEDVVSFMDLLDLDEELIDARLKCIMERETYSKKHLEGAVHLLQYKHLVNLQDNSDCDNDIECEFVAKLLKKICDDNIENICNIATLALGLNSSTLVSRCEHFIQQIFSNIVVRVVNMCEEPEEVTTDANVVLTLKSADSILRAVIKNERKLFLPLLDLPLKSILFSADESLKVHFLNSTVPKMYEAVVGYYILDAMWNCIKELHDNKEITLKVLSSLSDYYLPTADSKGNMVLKSNVVCYYEFWDCILHGLLSDDSSLRKISIYLAKRALDCVLAMDKDICVKSGNKTIFSWTTVESKELKVMWDNFFILIDSLEEKQSNIVLPSLQLFSLLKNMGTWLNCAFNMGLRHDNTEIRFKCIQHRLDIKLESVTEATVLLEALNDVNIYESPYDYVELKKQLLLFLLDSDVFTYIFRSIPSVKWLPVPLYHLSTILSSESFKNSITLNGDDLSKTITEILKVPCNNVPLRKAIHLNVSHLVGNCCIGMQWKQCLSIYLSLQIDYSSNNPFITYITKKLNIGDQNKEFYNFLMNTYTHIDFSILYLKSHGHDVIIFIGLLTEKMMKIDEIISRPYSDNLQFLNDTIYLLQLYNKTLNDDDMCVKTINEIVAIKYKTILLSVLNLLINNSKLTIEDIQLICTGLCSMSASLNIAEVKEDILQLYRTALLFIKDNGLALESRILALSMVYSLTHNPILLKYYKHEMLQLKDLIYITRKFENRQSIGRTRNVFYEKSCEIVDIYLADGKNIERYLKEITEYVEMVIECGGYGCLRICLKIMNRLLPHILKDGNNKFDIGKFMSRMWSEIEELKSNHQHSPCLEEFVLLILHEKLLDNPNYNNIVILYCKKIIDYGYLKNTPLFYLVREMNHKVLAQNHGHIIYVLSEILHFCPVPRKDIRITENLVGEVLQNKKYNLKKDSSDIYFNYQVQYMSILVLSKINDPEILETIETFIITRTDEVFKTKQRYHAHSQAHRILLTALQHLLMITLMKPVGNGRILSWSIELLGKIPHQSSVRICFEWYIALILYIMGTKLNEKSLRKIKNISLISQFMVIYWLAKHKITKGVCSTEEYEYVMDMLLSHTMGQMFNIRLHAQYLATKLYEAQKTEILKYSYTVKVIQKTFEDNKNDKSFIKLKSDYFINDFDIVKDLTPCFLYYFLLRNCEISNNESVDINYVKDILKKINMNVSKNDASDFSKEWKVSHKSDDEVFALNLKKNERNRVIDNMEVSSTIQKKYIPWKNMSDVNVYETEQKRASKSELIVVASLIDKLPNLGGLARTSEVFGVKTYVIDSLRHLQDRQFQGLSVSAERWVDVKEVRPGAALREYLVEMKAAGYCAVAAEQTSSSRPLQTFTFPKKTLLLLGHEKEGVPCDLLPLMDHCVEIPQQGFVRSLNVHVTAAIFVWEYARQNIL